MSELDKQYNKLVSLIEVYNTPRKLDQKIIANKIE